jgi:hypothetical protein
MIDWLSIFGILFYLFIIPVILFLLFSFPIHAIALSCIVLAIRAILS